eukprot:TRINITY_DN10904_c1_g2_i1.p1 TRINITY_DN10904_c1_g2~~TRINITY_DN10904_c1_g2_i1.p1  ORF type:complete len:1028 (+),score=355.69 TRINITY_DN10904_c1_g2_i1:426-3086(+)
MGTFSVAHSEKFTDFTELSHGMSTYCHPSGCSTWEVQDGVLTSGDNHNKYDVNTHLVFSIDIDADYGDVTIEYRVECELDNAVFLIYADDSVVLGQKVKTGIDFTWETVTFSLRRGAHLLRFAYEKANAGSVQSDRAFVRSIVVGGQERTVTACTECAAGTVANVTGQSDCFRCHAGQMRANSSACVACPEGEISPSGSDTCTAMPVCQFPIYTRCGPGGDQGSLQRTETWDQPDCKSDKPSATVACSACPAGYFRNQTGGGCTRCATGEHYDATEGKCVACGDGEYPVRELVYNGFDAIEGMNPVAGFEFDDEKLVAINTCSGLCRGPEAGNDAWKVQRVARTSADSTPAVLSTGHGHGPTAEVTFKLKVHMEMAGTLDFEYYFSGTTTCVTAVFSIEEVSPNNDVRTAKYPLVTNKASYEQRGLASDLGAIGTLKQNHAYTLTWAFTKNCHAGVDASHESTLNLATLNLTGLTGAGAAQCRPCPPGFQCPKAGPSPCPLGMHQPATGQTACQKCPAGEISNVLGSTECLACGTAKANAAQTTCIAVCRFSDPDDVTKTYDLTSIGNLLLGPVVDKAHLESRSRWYSEAPDVKNQTSLDLAAVQRYYMKLCEIVNDDTSEKEKCPSEGDAYVCQRITDTRAYSLGDFPSYSVLSGGKGVNVTFTGGTPCSSTDRKTYLTMNCDPEYSADKPRLEFMKEDPHCAYNFELTSQYACPVCGDDDYVPVAQECNKETLLREVTYFRKTESRCYGVRPPQRKTCTPTCTTADWEEVWQGSCSSDGVELKKWSLKSGVNCTMLGEGPIDNTGSVLPLSETQRSCLGRNTLGLTVLICACVVILMLLCVVQLYRMKRSAEQKYSRLSAEHNVTHGGVELESHDSHDQNVTIA